MKISNNSYGYIPIDRNDLNFLHEEIREVEEGFPVCKCSNCIPDEAQVLRNQMKYMNPENFEEILDDPSKSPTAIIQKPSKKKTSRPRGTKDSSLTEIQKLLAAALLL